MTWRPVHGNGFAVSRDLNPNLVAVKALKPLGQETRKHPPSQIRKLQASIQEFGFVLPIVTDGESRVIAGWAMVAAAKRLGLAEVPAVTITDLDEAKMRILRLALNRLGEDSGWDLDALKLEFSDILEISSDIDLRISGFETGEIDTAIGGSGNDEEDDLPPLDATSMPKTQPGDLWLLGDHRILCADALQSDSYVRLLGDDHAQMVFTDPPWNVPIAGHVSGHGAVKHGDFAMGCGEMSAHEFEAFLGTALGHAAACSVNGSVHYVCMHWSKIRELLGATADLYSDTLNLCVWSKTNGGMGSLYRSRHELVFVFKKGNAAHINNVELGRFGRNRSNIWEYGGQSALHGTKSKLSVHPTAKPVALVADAIRDCSHRHGIILDPFGGSGTTLIAADKTGRKARLIEIDPRFVDVTIRRWQNITGGAAIKADGAIT
jgi:DNA modification methylase